MESSFQEELKDLLFQVDDINVMKLLALGEEDRSLNSV